VLNGSLGAILISLLFFYRALTALTSVQDAWNGFLGVSGSLDNLQSFQNDLQQNQLNNGTNGFEGLKHKIEAQNVSFQYGKTLILSNISLLINNNTTVAFVGESGSGKTTMVNVLCGLLPLDKGKVLVDDMPISDMDRTSYQKRIGYITQEPVIFNDSIFNNVSFWAERNAENIARCRMALEKAAVWSFVESLTEGIDTQLGNNGINLSGGQKQRISIARELYKDVDILIMDEATSALDSETERVIQDNIESLKGKYTILIVAHRLSTIKNADEIVLMEKGSITSKGTFDELLTKRPNFRRMVELQEV
jgi:subfamily B ATP-binding cassette protein MsbA